MIPYPSLAWNVNYARWVVLSAQHGVISKRYMRYGHLSWARWICRNSEAIHHEAVDTTYVSNNLPGMRDPQCTTCDVHKEETLYTFLTPSYDRENVHKNVSSCTPITNPSNIISGRISPDSVNVDNPVIISKQQMHTFDREWSKVSQHIVNT